MKKFLAHIFLQTVLFCCLFLLFSFYFTSNTYAYSVTNQARQTDCTNQSFSCYANKYGFGNSPRSYQFSNSQKARMAEIKPFAIQAAKAYNSIPGHDKVEPQMLVWWAVYDTGGKIEYSNCANVSLQIQNCDRPWFWQLGYGAQFNHIKQLKDGFSQLYGDPNNETLVRQVGQAVLDYDKSQKSSPTCGGYSCVFPSYTLDAIFSNLSDSVLSKDAGDKSTISPSPYYWWASVLLRDPALNAYNMASILTVDIINKNSIHNWIGDYRKTWDGPMTDSLATVVSTWNNIPSTGINLPGNPKGGITSSDFTNQFGQPGGQYYDYYQFAYKNLFDNKSLFTIPASNSGVVSCNDPLTASLPADTKALILKKYGFRVSVDSGLNEEDQLAQTYNTLCLLFQSPTFVKLLGTINPDGSVANAMTLIIHKSPDYQKRCGTGNDFNTFQPEIYACSHPDANRFVFIHELGHVVYSRNISLSVQYDNLFTGAQLFPDKTNNHGQRFLPTDNCHFAGTSGFGKSAGRECFADMVAEYVVFNTYKHTITNRNPSVTFSEFPIDYTNWYNWVGQYVFGGTSYANQSSNSIVAYAKTLKDQITQACPPQYYNHGWEVGAYVKVYEKNKNCLTNMSLSTLGTHSQNVINELFQSISDFYYLQCVGFARAVAQGIGAPLGSDYRSSNQYYQFIPKTIGVNNVPGGVLPGDIALFSLHECAYPNIPFNRCPRQARFIVPHIGIVIDVGPTGFDLVEANGGNGTVDITKGYTYHYDSNFDGVLRLKKALP